MTKSDYFEKLKDPRWQRKRLEIMERDGFKCWYCDDASSPLSVHHSYYVKGRDPWNYPNFALVCLCENCHRVVQVQHASEFDMFELLLDFFLGSQDDLNLAFCVADNRRCEDALGRKVMLERFLKGFEVNTKAIDAQ